MNLRLIGIISAFIGITIPLFSQSVDSEIQWMSIEEAMVKQKENPKKILIEVYTTWCKVCHKLDKLSLSQQHIAEYINEHYYPVRFDAESRKSVYFMGTKYDYKKISSSGYHSFAYKITHGKLNYPSLVFLDKDLSVIQSINGFQTPSKLIRILTYFGEDYNRRMPWNDFNSSYNSIIYPSSNR